MKHILQTIAEYNGLKVSSYSGRGMYGNRNTCLAITIDGGHFGKHFGEVVDMCLEYIGDLSNDDNRSDIIESLRCSSKI